MATILNKNKEFDETRLKKHSLYYNEFIWESLIKTPRTDIFIKILKNLLIKEGKNIYDCDSYILPIFIQRNTLFGGFSYKSFSNIDNKNDFDLLDQETMVKWSKGNRITFINNIVNSLNSIGSISKYSRPLYYNSNNVIEDIVKISKVPDELIKDSSKDVLEYEVQYFYYWYINALNAQLFFNSVRSSTKECLQTGKSFFILMNFSIVGNPFGHACGLYIDGNKKEVEFFDPNGPTRPSIYDPNDDYPYYYESIKPFLDELFRDVPITFKYYPIELFPKGGVRGVEGASSYIIKSDITITNVCIWYTIRYFYDRTMVGDAEKVHRAYENKLYEVDSQDAFYDLIISFAEGIFSSIKIGEMNYLDMYLRACGGKPPDNVHFSLFDIPDEALDDEKTKKERRMHHKYMLAKLRDVVYQSMIERDKEESFLPY